MLVARRSRPYVTLYLRPSSRDSMAHAPACPLSNTRSGSRAGSSQPGVEMLDDGRLLVHLNVPLREFKATSSAVAPRLRSSSVDKGTRGKSQGSVGIRYLLELLWQAAGLNLWSPKFARARTEKVCWNRLWAVSDEILVGRGKSLQDWLLLIDRPGRLTAIPGSAEADKLIERRLVVGFTRAISQPTASGWVFDLEHEKQGIWVTDRAASAFFNSWFHGVVPACDRSWLFAAAVERAPKGWLAARSLTALPISPQWIPVESSHERRLFELLVDLEREFEKPIAAAGLPIVPDAILRDVEPNVAMEVAGRMPDPDYAARLAEKRRQYQRDGTPVWIWDTRLDMPAIPTA